MYRALVVVGKSSNFSWVLAHFPFLPKLVNTNFQAFEDMTENLQLQIIIIFELRNILTSTKRHLNALSKTQVEDGPQI